MGDSELLCNFRSCRRPLSDVAWVTFCSHIFCDLHGKPLIQTPVDCPACGTKLPVEMDVHRLVINPSEHFRSMVLAGLKPSMVMDICYRALTFWNYQKDQEHGYQRHVISKLRERLQQVEAYYEQAVRSLDDRFANTQRQFRDTQREHERLLEDMRATNELLADRTRQYHKLQGLYESLRKRTGRVRSRSLSPPGNGGSGALIEWPLAIMPDDGRRQTSSSGASATPTASHLRQHHRQQQQSVQLLNEAIQQQPNDGSARPTSAGSYHQHNLPHFSHLTSLIPLSQYQQHRSLVDSQVVPTSEGGRYQGRQQEYHEREASQSQPSGSVRPREQHRSFSLQTPQRYSSEDFTFRPAIFSDHDPGTENQGGSGEPSHNDNRPPA